MEGTHEVGRRPFMPDSTLNRRSVALYVAKPNQLSYQQKTAECLRFLEETGASAAMLDRLAAVLNRDLDNTIQRAETIAKPLIILALGAVVALIAAAVYQPLIEM